MAVAVAEVVLLGDDPKRPGAARQDVEPPVLHPLDDLRDLARAADVPQAHLRRPDDAEFRVALQALGEHRAVARLEDVQRDELVRQRDEAQREDREVADGAIGHPG